MALVVGTYTSNPVCPKCGGTEVGREHHPQQAVCPDGEATEHLHMTCGRCQAKWMTRTADSA